MRNLAAAVALLTRAAPAARAQDAAEGQKAFQRQCSACHNNTSSGAPQLTGRTFSGATMVSALWRHGPQMLSQMNAKKLAWPRFDGAQMSDLIAFLNSGKGKKP